MEISWCSLILYKYIIVLVYLVYMVKLMENYNSPLQTELLMAQTLQE